MSTNQPFNSNTHYDYEGDSYMSGTGGADTFVFTPDNNDKEVDTIEMFEPSLGDKIDLTAFGNAVTWDDLMDKITVSQIPGTSAHSGEIDLSDWGGGTIKIGMFEGVISSVENLTASMFKFSDELIRQDGDAGGNTLKGAYGLNDHLDGGEGVDVLYGYEGRDVVDGGAGNDVIYGGGGDDLIVGGKGNDTLFGNGAGRPGDSRTESDKDVFVYRPGDGHDDIIDFTAGEDQIDLRGYGNMSALADLDIAQQGNDVVIHFGGGVGSLTLKGTQLADLDDDDFLFQWESPDSNAPTVEELL